MKRDNQLKLLSAIRTSSSIEQINKVCQEIIFDELDKILLGNSNKKDIKKLCSRIFFPIKVQQRESIMRKSKFFALRTILPFVICVCCYWLVYSLLHLHWVSFIAAVLVAYVVNIKNNNAETSSEENHLTILSTFEELEMEIEIIISILSKERKLMQGEEMGLLPNSTFYPFEKQYKRVLKFLQSVYSKYLNLRDIDWDRLDEIEELFDVCGYKLIQYSDDYSDCFYISEVSGIAGIRTTNPAVINKGTGYCVLKGNVVFPKE